MKELFKPFGEVTVKRMFGGGGVYAEGLCFAIEQGGEVFLKVDELSQQARRGRFLALHPRRQGQADDDLLLALAGDRPHRDHELRRSDVAWTGGSAARSRSQGAKARQDEKDLKS